MNVTAKFICVLTITCLWMTPLVSFATTAKSDSMKLEAGKEGTAFKSLRIEGEDRIRIEFARPQLHLNIDPRSAPGLEWESVHSVLSASMMDLDTPFLTQHSEERSPMFARPWLETFDSDGVAKFRPDLKSVERWQMSLADSRGATVATYKGKGTPPKEIVWDGRTADGGIASPGVTYSFVLEAYDKAGNKRNFVGEGFEVKPYRLHTAGGVTMVFSGSELGSVDSMNRSRTAPVILTETASWLNQETDSARPVRITVTAQTFDQAKRLADAVVSHLYPLIVGDPNRLQAVTNVETDAPERGVIAVSTVSE